MHVITPRGPFLVTELGSTKKCSIFIWFIDENREVLSGETLFQRKGQLVPTLVQFKDTLVQLIAPELMGHIAIQHQHSQQQRQHSESASSSVGKPTQGTSVHDEDRRSEGDTTDNQCSSSTWKRDTAVNTNRNFK